MNACGINERMYVLVALIGKKRNYKSFNTSTDFSKYKVLCELTRT